MTEREVLLARDPCPMTLCIGGHAAKTSAFVGLLR
jgi:hypothetical protein